MKIAIASHNGNTVAYHLGRTRGFVVVEIEDGEVKSRTYRLVGDDETTVGARMRHRAGGEHRHDHGPYGEHRHDHGAHGHGHGAGHGAAVVETIRDCDVVIARGAGHGMVRNLTQAKKRLYLTELTSVEEAIAAFLRGELLPAVTQ